MIIRGDGISRIGLRAGVMRLLLAAFVLRALIPVGFMPDFGKAVDGVFKIVICSAYGAKTMALDADGVPVPGEPDGASHDQPCAFSGVHSIAVLNLEPAPVLAPIYGAVRLMPRLAVSLPPVRAGPQLGSRGPPLFS